MDDSAAFTTDTSSTTMNCAAGRAGHCGVSGEGGATGLAVDLDAVGSGPAGEALFLTAVRAGDVAWHGGGLFRSGVRGSIFTSGESGEHRLGCGLWELASEVDAVVELGDVRDGHLVDGPPIARRAFAFEDVAGAGSPAAVGRQVPLRTVGKVEAVSGHDVLLRAAGSAVLV
jgi:hypothetical protein